MVAGSRATGAGHTIAPAAALPRRDAGRTRRLRRVGRTVMPGAAATPPRTPERVGRHRRTCVVSLWKGPFADRSGKAGPLQRAGPRAPTMTCAGHLRGAIPGVAGGAALSAVAPRWIGGRLCRRCWQPRAQRTAAAAAGHARTALVRPGKTPAKMQKKHVWTAIQARHHAGKVHEKRAIASIIATTSETNCFSSYEWRLYYQF